MGEAAPRKCSRGCKRDALPGRTQCETCRDAHRIKMKERYHKYGHRIREKQNGYNARLRRSHEELLKVMTEAVEARLALRKLTGELSAERAISAPAS